MPRSCLATDSSITMLCTLSISLTDTCSGISTSAFAISSTSFFMVPLPRYKLATLAKWRICYKDKSKWNQIIILWLVYIFRRKHDLVKYSCAQSYRFSYFSCV
ncbi:hypothetical protein DESC_90063 [Desulfosarcina cetonica]|nr:hypothetical protein DESC_90063 [Desulfosarcina cetonica]